MSEFGRWLPVLSPPRGGAERLARALSAGSETPQPWRERFADALPLLATAGAIALALGVVRGEASSAQANARIERRLHAVANATPATVRIARGAAVERVSPAADVRVFLVMTHDP